MNRPTIPDRPSMRTRVGLPGSLILGLVGASVLVPSAAQAAEGVSSSYTVGCTIHPDQGSDSTDDPGGVTFAGARIDVASSPGTHTITADSSSLYELGGPGAREDCNGRAQYGDRLTVTPGTSGLTEGTEVPVEVTVVVRGSLGETFGSGESFSTLAEYGVEAALVSRDDCVLEEEFLSCTEPLSFSLDRERQVFGNEPGGGDPDGSVDLYYDHFYELETDGQVADTGDDWLETDVCGGFPPSCTVQDPVPGPAHPETFTATMTLVVGHEYTLSASALFGGSAGYYSGQIGDSSLSARARLDEFSVSLASTSGIGLAYASEGGPTDTTPPVIAGAEDVTVTSADGAAVPVAFSVTATDDIDGSVPVTCTPASGSPFSLGTTEVTCEASDTAGNTAEATFEVTVVAGPTVQLGAALTDLTVHHGIKQALQSKYDAAVAAFATGRDADGCGALRALAQQVSAQSGKELASSDAAVLSALVTQARVEQGC